MSAYPDYPDFDQAIERVQEFLRSNRITAPLTFIEHGDVLIARGQWWLRMRDATAARRRARHTYEAAVSRRLGVSLIAQCSLENSVGVSVGSPSDRDEAERLMYPHGLKLSIVTPLHSALVLQPEQWEALRARLADSGEALSCDPELLK
jgi:hypothetical protein